MKEKTIYVVTSGDYSDYRICSVFDSEEKAKAFMKIFEGDGNSDFNDIEEYELNPFKNESKKGYFAFFVRMEIDGNCLEVYQEKSTYGFTPIGTSYGFDINNNMYKHVIAKDKKHAIKITNEKRTELIALDKWKTKQ